MKRLFFFLLFLNALCAEAFNGKVVNRQQEPIIGATVCVLKADSSTAIVAVTDTLGRYKIEGAHYPLHLLIRYLGYQPAEVTFLAEPENEVATILEEDSHVLKEVVITPEVMQQFDSHNSFHFTEKDLARYPTFDRAMNVVPFVSVTADGAITYRGSSNVVVLLNGIKTSSAEIRALAKEDVLKVDVYENPPAQYALMGASAVINIITVRHIMGGNVAIDLKDSFRPMKGTNNVSAFLNSKSSRFSLLYNNDFDTYKRIKEDEQLSYNLGGTAYSKTKDGLPSYRHREKNSVTLGFMTHNGSKWQFNANLSAEFYTLKKDLEQNIQYSDRLGIFNGDNSLYNHYNSQSLNLYFTRNWDKNRQFLFDVTGTLYNTHYNSEYTETDQHQASTFHSLSSYKSNRRSILSTLQYATPGILGTWTFGVKNSYQYGVQEQKAANELTQSENTLYTYAQLYGKTGKFHYQFIAALKYINIRKNGEMRWSKLYPTPSLKLWYNPSKVLTFTMGYSLTANVPSISLMSETEQWLDNHYVYRGNSELKPYRIHQLYIYPSLTTKHWSISLIGLFNYTPKAIINTFELGSNYILQTYNNLKFISEIGGQLIVDYFPLQDKALKLHAVGIYLHRHGKEESGLTWNGYRYQLMASASYALKKWYFELYYQYPGQTMEGQLVTPRAESISFDVAYRPTKDMSIGLQWMQPFMDGFKEGEHTTADAIIQSYSTKNIRDLRNMISLKFTYNISYGKHIKTPSQRVKNMDNDSGLLTK